MLEWSHSSRLEAFRGVVVEIGWLLTPLDTAIQSIDTFLPKFEMLEKQSKWKSKFQWVLNDFCFMVTETIGSPESVKKKGTGDKGKH